MNRKLCFQSIAATFVITTFCLTWQVAAESPVYSVRPSCNSCGTCSIRPGTYGYNDTWWRQWPTQYRPEVSDPRGVGGTIIPPPPGVPEAKLPVLPSKPAMSGGGPGTSILPQQGGLGPSTSGTITAPGGVGPVAPGPDAFPGAFPGNIQPLTPPSPGGESGEKPALLTPKELTPKESAPKGTAPKEPATKEPAPSGAAEPAAGLALPKSPTIEPSTSEPGKTFDREKPSADPSKSAAPPLGEPAPIKPTAPGAAVRRGHGTIASGHPGSQPAIEPATGTQVDSNADRPPQRDGSLHTTSFEQRSQKAKKTLPNALDGYCPVELRENAKWTTGRSEFRATYQGHAYYFSTAAAMKQFTAAPEKYAPAQGGNDAVLAMEEDRVVPGSIQHSAVWRGQLYLFASAANLAAFREDPARYAKRPRSLEEPQQSHGPATEDEPAPQPDSRPPAEPKALPQLQLPGDSL